VHLLGVLKYHQEYHLCDEVNKKLILSRDVIFLEFSKNEKNIEMQLDHLNKFTHVKTYNEFDYEIPHLEGGIPIWSLLLKHHLTLMKKLQPLH
jgi:hypothetical protein